MYFVFLPLLFFVSFWGLLVLNVQPCRPATCYFIYWIRILCSQQINDDDEEEEDKEEERHHLWRQSYCLSYLCSVSVTLHAELYSHVAFIPWLLSWISLWNNLPADLRRHSHSLRTFGQKQKHYLFTCLNTIIYTTSLWLALEFISHVAFISVAAVPHIALQSCLKSENRSRFCL